MKVFQAYHLNQDDCETGWHKSEADARCACEEENHLTDDEAAKICVRELEITNQQVEAVKFAMESARKGLFGSPAFDISTSDF